MPETTTTITTIRRRRAPRKLRRRIVIRARKLIVRTRGERAGVRLRRVSAPKTS